jgi:hypothetical protein
MAIAEAYLAARCNRPGFEIVNHFTYGLVPHGRRGIRSSFAGGPPETREAHLFVR